MNEQIRSLFPAAERYTYLNSAATSPLPIPSVEAVTKQLKDVSEHGMAHFTEWIETKNRARDLVSKLLGVRADQVAFMRNTSDGIASIANGIRWESGDNIVSFAGEFPANFYAWRRIRDAFGAQLRLCPERSGRIDLDEFLSLIDTRTRVVSISCVQYASGFRADLERIGKAARSVDALFVVDIIQAFGAMGFDLPAQYVDVACGGSHKWLCGPEGCGIIYISDRARERAEPTSVGWISVQTPWDFEDREQPFKPNALAWESGTAGSSLFYGLEQSLKILNETGLANIEKYLESLSDMLCDSVAAKGYEIVSSRRPGEKSAIVCIRHRDGLTSSQIAEQLQKQNVVVSPRGDRLRIAPHFFNNEKDLETLIDALP
jgi:selenocysteine lyase/cysteine desulfurase